MQDAVSPPKGPTALFFLLSGVSAFAAVSIEMYLPALSMIRADLHAKPGQVELTISAFLIALAAGQLFYGPLSDRIGRRRPLLLGLFIYCLASTACAMATTVEQLIVFRLLQALGGCAGPVMARAIVRDGYPASQVAHILSLMSLITGLAPLLSPLAGSAVLQLASWRAILWTQTGFGVTMLTGAVLMLKERDLPTNSLAAPSIGAAYLAVLQNRRTMGYALSGGLSGSVIFIYATCLPTVALNRYRLTPFQLSEVLALGAGLMLVCTQVNRPLLRRASSDRILKTVNALSLPLSVALCIIAWSDVGGFAGLMAPMLLIIALRGFTVPNSTAAALLSERHHVGIASALLGAGTFALGALMSAIAAEFADGTARPMAIIVLLALILAALVLHKVPPAEHGIGP